MTADNGIKRRRQADGANGKDGQGAATGGAVDRASSKGSVARQDQDGGGGIVSSIALVVLASQWPLILGLIFGGCCSNAFFLELGTGAVPSAGTLITFAQFLGTAITCVPSQLEWPEQTVASSSADRVKGTTRTRFPRFKSPKVPISRWSIQVALYLTTSLLNNAAFAFDIPMSVHIVFRSGGLVINMILGWTLERRRYNVMQVLSVLIVTVGVISATLFAQPSTSTSSATSASPARVSPTYLLGVSLLLLALVLSGLMGLYQERTFKKYGRDNWQEALFYAHTLSLPILLAQWQRLSDEARLANATAPIWIGFLDKDAVATAAMNAVSLSSGPRSTSVRRNALNLGPQCALTRFSATPIWYSTGARFAQCHSNPAFATLQPTRSFTVPSFWPILALNVLTQLLCINGVNRLTAQVTSLTVTLVLTLRKATSLAISVVWIGGRTGNIGLWSGAGAVLLGTIGYTLASSASASKSSTNTSRRKEKDALK